MILEPEIAQAAVEDAVKMAEPRDRHSPADGGREDAPGCG
jgi:hypothetical protein